MIFRLIIDYSTVVISSSLGPNVKYVAYFPLFSGFSFGHGLYEDLLFVFIKIIFFYIISGAKERIYKSKGHKSNVQV